MLMHNMNSTIHELYLTWGFIINLHYVVLKLLKSISADFKELKLSEKYEEFIDYWISSNYRYKHLPEIEQE